MIEVKIKGKEVKADVIYAKVVKEVNKISFAKVHLTDPDGAAKFQVLEVEKDAMKFGNEIEIHYTGEDKSNTLIFKGIITKQSIKIRPNRMSYAELECRHESVKLTLDRKYKVFEDKSDKDMVREILGEYSLDTGKLGDLPATKHEKLVQYYTTDWDFVLMRADANGAIVVDHTEKNKTALFIDAPKKKSVLNISYGEKVIDFQASIDARNQIKESKAFSWDIKKQEVVASEGKEEKNSNSLAPDAAKVFKQKKHHYFPFQAPAEDLKRWATTRFSKSGFGLIEGIVKVKEIKALNLSPGSMVKLDNFTTGFNGDVFVGGVEHVYESNKWLSTITLGMPPKTYAEQNPDISAPAAAGISGPVRGLALGKIVGILDKKLDNYRIEVKLVHLEKTIFARLATFYANTTNEAGIYFMPEVDDEVIVGFIHQDAQEPVILGSVYSKGKGKSPYEPEEENLKKAIITKNKLKIEFHDEKGSEVITIATPEDKNYIKLDVKEKKIEIQDEHTNLIKMDEKGITITSSKDISMTAKGKVTIEGKKAVSMKSSGDAVSIQGKSTTVKGDTQVSVESKQTTVKGTAQTVIDGGTIMIG